MGKKGTISELEMGQILRRYSAVTVMGLIREIAKCGSSKLDFNALVKKSVTGISCAREYQALWRHIAYRAELDDFYDEDAEVLDDDSDLEFELEPSPSIGSDVAADAAAWVEADMQRYGINPSKRNADGHVKSKVGNGESRYMSRDIKPAVGNQSAALSGLSASGVDVNAKEGSAPAGDGNSTSPSVTANQVSSSPLEYGPGQSERKKRKLWTSEEDQALMAAVEKCGEGNWTHILKGVFTHDRTAAQLSQRWALIRKRKDFHTAAAARVTCASSTGTSDVQQESNNLSSSADRLHIGQNGEQPSAAVVAAPGSISPPSAIPCTNSEPTTSGQAQSCQKQRGVLSDSSSPSTSASGAQVVAASCNPEGIVVKTEVQGTTGGGSSATKTSTVTHRISSAAVGTSRPTGGSSAPAAGLGTEQVRCTVAKGSSSSVSASRSIAPGAVVVSPATAQAASYGSSEMWPAGTISAPAGQGSVQAKHTVARGNVGPSSGRMVVMTKQSMTGPNPGVQAAAVAAGARIAPASAAASLLKAAQSGNVVHIGPGGVPISKSGLQSQAGPNGGVQAAAVAAGARIAPASAAASMLKAAQSGNVVHIGPGGVPMNKSGHQSQPGPNGGAIVHYIRTGAGASAPSLGALRLSQQTKPLAGKSICASQNGNSIAAKSQSTPSLASATGQIVALPSSQSR